MIRWRAVRVGLLGWAACMVLVAALMLGLFLGIVALIGLGTHPGPCRTAIQEQVDEFGCTGP
jgi:hypothetical protein